MINYSQSGKLYLSTSFLTFTSLDRRSCRLTLPLATVRRVEKLAPGQEGTEFGAFALALTLFHGLRIVSLIIRSDLVQNADQHEFDRSFNSILCGRQTINSAQTCESA